MLQLVNDVKLAWRSLRRSPGFALAVILTLGIALGANGAMFGIADRLFFSEPPHIVEPGRVYRVLVARWQEQGFFPRTPSMSYAAFTDFRDRTSSFSQVAAALEAELSLGAGADTRSVATRYASGLYFTLLGTRPARGRFFGEEDDRLPTGSNVAVVSHQVWQTVFGGADSITGARIRLNEAPFEIIGVAPAGFTGADLSGIPQLHQEALRRLGALPDVESVGLLHPAPFLGSVAANVRAPGIDSMPRLTGGGPYIFTATSGALRALEVRLLRGRLWTDADLDSAGQPTVIITKQMADAVWPGQDPLQTCLIVSQRSCAPVVGVINDFRRQQLRDAPFMALFWPMGVGGDTPPGSPQMLVRGDVRRAEPVIRRALLAIDPTQPYTTIVAYEQ